MLSAPAINDIPNASAPRAPQVSEEMIRAAAVLESRGVQTAQIARVLGGIEMLAHVRSLPRYVEVLAEIMADTVHTSIDTDDRWDRIERDALQALGDQLSTHGKHLDTGILLGIATKSNLAKRRHGFGAHEPLSHTGAADAPVVINIPTILVQRLQLVSRQQIETDAVFARDREAQTIIDSAPTTETPRELTAFAERITTDDVSKALGLDVTQKQTAPPAADIKQRQIAALDSANSHLIARGEG